MQTRCVNKLPERFDPIIQGVQYRGMPLSQYRVWCLELLQQRAREVPDVHREKLQHTLSARNCWQPLFALEKPGSRYDEGQSAPFQGRKVHYHNRKA
jgi:hypothetical protein